MVTLRFATAAGLAYGLRTPLGASEELDQVLNQDRWRLLEKLTVDVG